LDPVRKKVIKISSEISKPFDWFGVKRNNFIKYVLSEKIFELSDNQKV
jgi:hypothetical protein